MILLTGATGHVGGRLLQRLQADGHAVRCLVRTAGSLDGEAGPSTEEVVGDIADAAAVRTAMEGVDTAYYLVHSLTESGDFGEAERAAAEGFGRAALAAGTRRIVYLGGLARGDDLSEHLESRHEVGRVLRDSGVPTIEFRASIVIGSGSASFDLVLSLVEGLPIVPLPSWADAEAQPIAVDDVVAYLDAALVVEVDGSVVYEIGGPDRLSYRELVEEVAGRRGLQTAVLPVPMLGSVPREWLERFSTEGTRVAVKLVEGLRYDSTVEDETALRVFPIRPRPLGDAIETALAS